MKILVIEDDARFASLLERAIREAGWDTIMQPGAACFSACPYILAAGVERQVSRSALVGVDQLCAGEASEDGELLAGAAGQGAERDGASPQRPGLDGKCAQGAVRPAHR